MLQSPKKLQSVEPAPMKAGSVNASEDSAASQVKTDPGQKFSSGTPPGAERTGLAGWLSRQAGIMTPHRHIPDWLKLKIRVLDSIVLGLACLVTYVLVTLVLSRMYFISKDSQLLGGMWAVVATIFVIRDSYRQSVTAAASRMTATFVSFLVCLIYLVFLPFHPWGLALLIGVSALIVTLIGRPQDAVVVAITTTVVMVVAALSPEHAWMQPILRLADTIVGVAVGIAAVWISQRAIRRWIAPDGSSRAAPVGRESSP
jgi:hypothetical protein